MASLTIECVIFRIHRISFSLSKVLALFLCIRVYTSRSSLLTSFDTILLSLHVIGGKGIGRILKGGRGRFQ